MTLIDRRTAVMHNPLMALFRAALTITLHFTISDAERIFIINWALVLVNTIGRLLRDRPTAQRDPPTAHDKMFSVLAEQYSKHVMLLRWFFLVTGKPFSTSLSGCD